MDKHYDKELKKIPFYSVHPEYLPFIGDDYKRYRIMIIGESHFIPQTKDDARFDIEYFNNYWWNGTCNELFDRYKAWFNTRSVINDYLSGYRTRSHGIFTNVVKSFSDVVLGESIDRITTKESQKFNCFAFMNFFQMPSLYKGEKYWVSLEKNASSMDEAINIWNVSVANSSKVLDSVIDVMEPLLVIFVSQSAYYAYRDSKSKYSQSRIIKHTCHPGCSYWNRKRANGLSGKDDFENMLKEIYKN